jgi:hypothetical protein
VFGDATSTRPSGSAARRIPSGRALSALASRPALCVALALAAQACRCDPSPTGSPSAPAASAPAVVVERDPELRSRLDATLAAKGPGYVPRTRHTTNDGRPKHTNRLILQSSPYLLQHAHNPVDWFPWGDEALERAKSLGRPIFLSVGYSTCHWCHVMEAESFEDEEIAAYLNAHFIAIKVDREERPDLDAVYMRFVQSLTGGGGWPMTVMLTPEREPFFGGTYLPPRAGARGSRAGLLEVLREESARFETDPEGALRDVADASARMRARAQPSAAGTVDPAAVLATLRQQAADVFDPVQGGARGAPKFPSAFPVRAMLWVGAGEDGATELAMAESTLRHMRAGGIYDHVGGGFHRYATDAAWRVPHFEKMLYDNASLALTYVEAFQATGEPLFEATARATLDYLLTEMQAPDGGFYSATDADSPGPDGKREEGLFFTWTTAELEAALGLDDARLAEEVWNVGRGAAVDGRSILFENPASSRGPTPALDQVRAKLHAARARRAPPLRDDKILVAWNGLTISALARAAFVLDEPRYRVAAERSAEALLAEVRAGRPLPHQLVGGKPAGLAFADDYACLGAALLDLFELTSDARWLEQAVALMDELERSFADAGAGGYYLTSAAHETLFVRDKPAHDGPVPSPSSVAALTWQRLYAFTDTEAQRVRAEATLSAFARPLAASPLSLDQLALAVFWAAAPTRELVLVMPQRSTPTSATREPLLEPLRRGLFPRIVRVVGTEAELEKLGARVPWVKDKPLKNGKPTAYLCEGGACRLPTTDAGELERQLRSRDRPIP